MGVNNLPKVVTRQRDGRGPNSRPLSHQSDALDTRLSSHPLVETQEWKQGKEKEVKKIAQCRKLLGAKNALN